MRMRMRMRMGMRMRTRARARVRVYLVLRHVVVHLVICDVIGLIWGERESKEGLSGNATPTPHPHHSEPLGLGPQRTLRLRDPVARLFILKMKYARGV